MAGGAKSVVRGEAGHQVAAAAYLASNRAAPMFRYLRSVPLLI